MLEDMEILIQERDKIQKIDEEILLLLEKRINSAHVIGAIKKKNGKPIYVPEIEKQKIEKLSTASTYPGLVETIWPVIMCYTRSIE